VTAHDRYAQLLGGVVHLGAYGVYGLAVGADGKHDAAKKEGWLNAERCDVIGVYVYGFHAYAFNRARDGVHGYDGVFGAHVYDCAVYSGGWTKLDFLSGCT